MVLREHLVSLRMHCHRSNDAEVSLNKHAPPRPSCLFFVCLCVRIFSANPAFPCPPPPCFLFSSFSRSLARYLAFTNQGSRKFRQELGRAVQAQSKIDPDTDDFREAVDRAMALVPEGVLDEPVGDAPPCALGAAHALEA